MKTAIKAIIAMLVSVVPALAAGSKDASEVSFLVVLFFAFGALILLFQLVPGIILFGTMIKELFVRSPKAGPLKAGADAHEE
jgi:hypothetical protein